MSYIFKVSTWDLHFKKANITLEGENTNFFLISAKANIILFAYSRVKISAFSWVQFFPRLVAANRVPLHLE